MAECNIKRSQVYFPSKAWTGSNNIFDINDRAIALGFDYLAYGESGFIYMTGYPMNKQKNTGFTEKDLVEG